MQKHHLEKCGGGEGKSSIKSKTFFFNGKLTSIGIVFCFNKTLFTLFDYNYVRIKCLLMTEDWKLLISSSKMREYIFKNCEQNLYLKINVNLKLSGLYSSLFVIRFSLIFQKNFWWWGLKTEKSRIFLPEKQFRINCFCDSKQEVVYFWEKNGISISNYGSFLFPPPHHQNFF